MVEFRKNDLLKQVNLAAREYTISVVLFRHAIGEMLGVNVTDMECLALIFYKGLATPSEISRYIGLTSGATTAMLDRLEKARLIERRPNPNDRRGTLIFLTNERNKELDGLFAPSREAINELTASYSEVELAVIADYLKKLVELWERQRDRLKQTLADNPS